MTQVSLLKSNRPSISTPLVFLLLFVLFGIGLWLIFAKALPSFRVTSNEAKKAQEEFEQLLSEEEQIAVLLSNATTLPSEKVAKAFDILPETPETESLLANLEHIALTSGLALGSLNLSEAKEQTGTDDTQLKLPLGVVPVKVSMTLAGSYERLLAFLSLVEENARLLDPYKLDIRQILDPARKNLEFQLEFFTYYLPSS